MTALWKWGNERPKRDRRQAWEEVALILGGTFVPGERPSADRVTIEHDPWTIELETYTVHTGESSVTYTRARAFFINQVDARLRIRKRNPFDTILESLGLGGVEPGIRDFAERYVVRGRPEDRLRSVLSPGLVEALLAEPAVTVSVKKTSRKYRKIHGPLVREAGAHRKGVVTEPHRLVGLITVAKEVMRALEGAGIARRHGVVEIEPRPW